jgi:uncharacterized protein YqgC (DUF456 family)
VQTLIIVAADGFFFGIVGVVAPIIRSMAIICVAVLSALFLGPELIQKTVTGASGRRSVSSA